MSAFANAGLHFYDRTASNLPRGTSPAAQISPRQLGLFIVHHTTGLNLGHRDPFVWWRQIHDYHVYGRSYRDIAYNYGVSRDADPEVAHILTGRGSDRVGGHTRGQNSRGVGVAVLGDGSRHDNITPGVRRALQLLWYLHASTARPGTGLRVHADFVATACPGGVLRQAALHQFRVHKYPGAVAPPARPEAQPVLAPGVDWAALRRLLEAVKRQVLRRDDRGLAVGILQRRLRQLGFNEAGMVDRDPNRAIFGPRTLRQVRRFQGARRIQVDGVVGPQTWGRLYP